MNNFKCWIGLVVFWGVAPFAQAKLKEQIRNQCSVSGLQAQNDVQSIVQWRLQETQSTQRQIDARAQGRSGMSELQLARAETSHQRQQVKVENLRFKHTQCIMGLLKDELGENDSFATLAKSVKGQAALREVQELLTEDRKSLQSLEQDLKTCLKNKSNKTEDCHLNRHQSEILPYQRIEILEDLERAWTSRDPRLTRKNLAQYFQESLSDVRNRIKEITDSLSASESSEAMQNPKEHSALQ